MDALDINAGGKTITIAKDGGDWKMSKPVQTKADFGSVEGLVGRLQTVQMKSIVADAPANLKKYGLDKPEATINVGLGSARATLLFGGKAADNTVYARNASKTSVVTVESALLDDMKKSADEYRRKDVFELQQLNQVRPRIARAVPTHAQRLAAAGRTRSQAARRTSSRRRTRASPSSATGCSPSISGSRSPAARCSTKSEGPARQRPDYVDQCSPFWESDDIGGKSSYEA